MEEGGEEAECRVGGYVEHVGGEMAGGMEVLMRVCSCSCSYASVRSLSTVGLRFKKVAVAMMICIRADGSRKALQQCSTRSLLASMIDQMSCLSAVVPAAFLA